MGICAGPVWRTDRPLSDANLCSPSRRRWPMAAMWAIPASSRRVLMVATAAAIETAPYQKEPVVKTCPGLAASRNRSFPATTASA